MRAAKRAGAAVDLVLRGAYTSLVQSARAPVAQLDRAMAYGTNLTPQNHGFSVVFSFQGDNRRA
jgi:hypothetical protein